MSYEYHTNTNVYFLRHKIGARR